MERKAFVTALHAAATFPAGPRGLPPALVVAAVRADYLGRLIAYPPLKAALDAGPFTVGPMSEAELRLAVTGPAAEAGLVVEPAVVEAVIAELRDEAGGGLGSGVLPLMSQAMAATWERREGNELTLRGYRRAGGVADAVNRGAQAAYDALTSVAAGRGPPGVYPADRHHGGWPVRAAPVPQGRSEFPGTARWPRTSTRSSASSAPGGCWSSEKTASRSPMTRCCRPGNSSGTGWETTSSTGPCTARSSPTRPPGTATAGTRPTCTGRGGWPPSTPPRPAGRARPPATPRCLPPARRSSAPRIAPRGRATRRRRGVIAGLLALTVIAVSAAGIAVRDAADASRQAANASRQHAIALSRQLAAESLAADSASPLTARRLAVAAWRVFPTGQAGSVLASLLMEQQQGGILPGDPSNGGVSNSGVQPGRQAAGRRLRRRLCTAVEPGHRAGRRRLPSRLIPVRGAA